MTSAVKGCIIRPNGDVTELHFTRFADKYVLPTDPIFHDVQPTANSVRLELPILVARLNSVDLIPRGPYHNNRPATCLNIAHSGMAPLTWQYRVGAVLVVRMDRKPLCCMHLEALWRFHWALLSEMNTLSCDKLMRKKVNRKSFEAFWCDYQGKQIAVGREDWEDVPSPYEV
jgi:hypothetical protein